MAQLLLFQLMLYSQETNKMLSSKDHKTHATSKNYCDLSQFFF